MKVLLILKLRVLKNSSNDYKTVIFSKIPLLIEPILILLSHDAEEIRRAA